jgi:uncharacterized protein
VTLKIGAGAGMTAAQWVAVFMVLALVVPLFEELIFRKWLFERLSGHGIAAAFPVISVVVFGLVHLGQSAVKIFTIMMLGALCTWLFVRTRNVLWPFLAHALNNGLALVLARLGF